MTPETADEPTKISTVEVRQGQNANVRYVLFASMALALMAFAYFALFVH